MKVTVNLTASAEVDIDLTEENIIEVMKDYNGDFAEWAKSNYSDYMGFNDFDVDFEDCDYNEEQAEKLLKKSKEILGFDDNFNIDKQIYLKTMLNKCVCDKPHDVEKINIDIDLVSKAINYIDINNPKFELNYILLDGDTISATDTKSLINITGHKFNEFKNVLFPPYFIAPLKDGGEVFIDEDNKVYLQYKNYWLSGYHEIYREPSFPEVSRILLSDEGRANASFIPMKKFSSNSITQKYENNINPKNLIKFKVFNKECYLNEKYYNDIISIHEDIDFVYALSNNSPIHFEGKNIKVVVMPYIINSEKVSK